MIDGSHADRSCWQGPLKRVGPSTLELDLAFTPESRPPPPPLPVVPAYEAQDRDQESNSGGGEGTGKRKTLRAPGLGPQLIASI